VNSDRLALARVSTTDTIVNELRSQILDGTLEPGTHLREIELSERFGVSRQSLRAALAELVHLGLLRREAHRGVWVPTVTRGDIRDLYLMREGGALGRGHDAAAMHCLPDRPAHAAARAPARARALDGGPIEPGGGRADARATGHHGCGCPRRGCAAADAAQGCLSPARLTKSARWSARPPATPTPRPCWPGIGAERTTMQRL
jgi:Bacterial regulatory proteins, gntR family